MSDNIYLELRNIKKSFSGIVANDNISLKVKKGEIHALLGENGAGKSTLMNILTGLYIPDEGKILLKGNEVKIKSPKDAINYGIGMVHQHFMLVDSLSVAENIIIGWHEQGFLINKQDLKKRIKSLSINYDLEIDPAAIIHDLSPGEKQRVEIVKMLYRNVKLLILDEPTSVLTPQESKNLFKNLRVMKAQGQTVIFISHKLNEIMEIADTVSVLRRGKYITSKNKNKTNPKELARLMIGRDMQRIEKKDLIGGDRDKTLSVKGLSALDEDGRICLDGINLEVRQGEVVGVAGVSGNGQTELAEVLTGLRPTSGGVIRIDGEVVSGKAKAFIEKGISHIPEDRIGTGSIPSFTCIENVIMKRYKSKPILRGFAIDNKAALKIGMEMLNEYDVRMPSETAPAKLLSGGNMQKLILARELSCNPKVIIAVHPTYGLDVSAVEMVHKCLIAEQEKGTAILLVSEDLDELLTLSDSLTVMFKGKVTPKRDIHDWTIDEIGYAMMGLKNEKEIGKLYDKN